MTEPHSPSPGDQPDGQPKHSTPHRAKGKRSVFSKRQKWNKAAPLRTFYNRLLRVLFKLLGRIEIRGLEKLPAQGGTIIIINHVHWIDPLLLLPYVPRPITPLAKVEAFEWPPMRWIVEPYGSIPVHRGEVDLQAIRGASEVLNEGGLVLLSPEGMRSKTGALIEAQEGLAFLATRTNAWIVPVALVGTTEAYKHFWKLQRATIQITIGDPFKFEHPAGQKVGREQLHDMTDHAMRRLAALLPPEMRGVYK